MRKRGRLGSFLVILSVLVIGTVVGYYLKGFEDWANNSGRPVIFEDVSDALLQKVGVPFSRPSSAKNAVVASLGNGVGDIVWYASIEVGNIEANALLRDLKSKGEIRPARCVPKAYYLDQISPELAHKLWPNNKFSQSQVFISRNSHVAYTPDTASFHFYGWPQIETEFNDPTVQGGCTTDNEDGLPESKITNSK